MHDNKKLGFFVSHIGRPGLIWERRTTRLGKIAVFELLAGGIRRLGITVAVHDFAIGLAQPPGGAGVAFGAPEKNRGSFLDLNGKRVGAVRPLAS